MLPEATNENFSAVLQMRTHFPLCHLNINSLRCKIIDLRKIISYTDIDLISITETKIDASFPDAQFHTENYLSFRHDRNKHGGGIFTFVKSGLLTKTYTQFGIQVKKCLQFE